MSQSNEYFEDRSEPLKFWTRILTRAGSFTPAELLGPKQFHLCRKPGIQLAVW